MLSFRPVPLHRAHRRCCCLGLALLLVLAPSGVAAQIDEDVLDAARDSVREAFDPARAGIFYAASINFAVQPDISTASFSLDGLLDQGLADPRLDNIRLPVRRHFDLHRPNLSGFLQATVAYQDLSMGIPIFDGSLRSDWRSRGVDIGGGLEYGLTDRWTVRSSLNLGVADIRNKADYARAPLGEFLRPVFEGIVFDWDTRAWVAGAALGADYERDFDAFRLLTRMTASANRIRSFDASSTDIDFDDVASTLDIAINSVHPIGHLRKVPVSLVTILGATSLVGDARGELGFDEFAEAGLALQFDLRPVGLAIDDFRVGLKAIDGPDVSGWSLVIGRGL